MDSASTTRCCSALALVALGAALSVSFIAAAPAQRSDPPGLGPGPGPGAATDGRFGKTVLLSPFPSRTHYTLQLNNQLTAPPAYEGGRGYFSIEGDRIVAYDLVLGTQLWMVSGNPLSTPTVGGDLLFVNQGGQLTALRTSDGTTAWTRPFPDALVAPLTWQDGWLLAVTASDLFAFHATDGTPAWRQAVAGARATPAIDGDRLYVSLTDRRVLALRMDTGVQLWERTIGGPPNEILASGDRLFVGSNDNSLYCLEAKDGQIAWRWPTGADIVSKPTADRDRVYFVSLDNVLRALNRRNGVQQWKKVLTFRPAWPPLHAADTVIVAGVSGSAKAFFLKNGSAAGELAIDAANEVAAPLYAFQSPATRGPMVIVVTRAIGEGASILAISRAIEPPIAPFVALPGIIPISVPKT